jgi:uncharacterized membrane protein YeiH
MDIIFQVIEYVGIIAFAVSGAMVAIDKEADLVGVFLMAIVTSFGGGILRDVMLGHNPPRFFVDFGIEIAIASVTALIVFLAAVIFKRKYVENENNIGRINNIFDAIGLGIFASYGTGIVIEAGYTSPFIAITLGGFISSCFGGICRDLALNDIPFVIRKRIYALASVAGSTAYYVLFMYFSVDGVWATLIGILTTFVLRMCATAFKWNMPKAIDFEALAIQDGEDDYK